MVVITRTAAEILEKLSTSAIYVILGVGAVPKNSTSTRSVKEAMSNKNWSIVLKSLTNFTIEKSLRFSICLETLTSNG